MKAKTCYLISNRENNKRINFNVDITTKDEYDESQLTNLKKISFKNKKNHFNETSKDTKKNKTISFLDKMNNIQEDISAFSPCINELKVKADITTTVQNMFKNDVNCFELLDNYLNNYSRERNENLLSMYEFLYHKLKYKNDIKTERQLYECNV